jgi:hypothetical protein
MPVRSLTGLPRSDPVWEGGQLRPGAFDAFREAFEKAGIDDRSSKRDRLISPHSEEVLLDGS